jgi:hypothetical protein
MSISTQEIEEKITDVNNEMAEAYDDYMQNQQRNDYDRLSLSIVSNFVAWLEKSISPSYQMPDEDAIYKLANCEITALDLSERVRDINGFSEEILANVDFDSDKHQNNCEIILGGLFTPRLVAVELTQLIQIYSNNDIKSDLTEEYAWLFDYIRNIASNEQNASFIDTLRDALAAMPNQRKESKSNAILGVLKEIKEEIGTNQEKYKMHNPFGGSFFTKATGGLPDVVSVYTEKDDTDTDGKNMLNFTAANSLTDLSIETDQLERHSCMLALAIYRNGGKVDSNIGQIINGVVGDKTIANYSKRQRVLVDAISGNANEDNEVKYLLGELEIPTEDLPKIKNILQERINITFFQTYVAKAPDKKIANGVLKDDGIDGDVEARKELYREMNQWNSYFLGNSQKIFNVYLDRNRPEIIDSMTTNQNNKPTPLAGAKHIKAHADEIKDFINDKFVSQNLPISIFLEGTAKPNEADTPLIEYDAELLSAAGSIELSMMSMITSSDIMKESLLQNIFDVLESELNQAEDSKIKLELISQLQDVQNYAGKVLDNRGARAQNLGQYYFKSAIQWRLDGVQLDAESERLDAENKELKAQRLDEKISSQMDEIKELKAQIAINASREAKIKELKAAAAADKKNSGNTKTR